MTIRNCLAKIIPALWCSLLMAAAPAAAALPVKRRPAAKAAARKAAPPPAPTRRPAAGELAALVRAWRAAPSPVQRAALAKYAAAHTSGAPGALARLALGVVDFESRDFAASAADLRGVAAKLPEIADYAAYYRVAAGVEAEDFEGVGAELAAVRGRSAPSPLAARSWILEARALKAAAPAQAVRLLREHYAELPQPEGDLALGDCYQAARDLPRAAEFYNRVYSSRISGDASLRAAAGLVALRDVMGAAFPEPLPSQSLLRAGLLAAASDFVRARSAYQEVAQGPPSLERDQALVRAAYVDFPNGRVSAACAALRGLNLAPSEADAERLYYLAECGRSLADEGAMLDAVRKLEARYRASPWRLKALITAASRFLLANRPDDYLPLYRAAYESFPDDPLAGLCHWKVTFQAWLRDPGAATELLREHLLRYPAHATAGASLYFLGRAAERERDFAAARACYQRLSAVYQNTYYAGLARAGLQSADIAGAGVSERTRAFLTTVAWPGARPVSDTPTEATALRIRRSRLLRSAGLDDMADAELRFGARAGAQPAPLAMELAASAAAPYLAMRAMKSLVPDYLNLPLAGAPRRFWEFLFPLPWRQDLFAAARQRHLDPFLVAGLIRQESEFNPQALSRAGAYGLTQVRPATGRTFARNAGVARFSARSLFQPAANLNVGAAVLRSMLDSNGGSLERTLASYNAGPNRVAEWQGWAPFREPAEFVESIPFSETRDYVQAVLRNAEVYRRLYQ